MCVRTHEQLSTHIYVYTLHVYIHYTYIGWVLRACESARTVCVRTCVSNVGWIFNFDLFVCLSLPLSLCCLSPTISFRLAFVPIRCAKLRCFMLVQFLVVTIVCATAVATAAAQRFSFSCSSGIHSHANTHTHTHDYSKERITCRLERTRRILNECGW